MESTIQKVLSQPSVEIATGSKGEIKITVKSYDDSIDTACEKAIKIFDLLVKKYTPAG